MTRPLLRVLAAAAVILLAVPRPSQACVHAPVDAPDPITQKGQRLLVIHDGKSQTTVLRVDYDAGAAVQQLALVVPVPAVPESYATGNPKLFDALDTWAPMVRDVPRAARAKSKGEKGVAPASAPTLQLFEPVETGPYLIQPIKARGQAGADALRDWLKDNGFAPIPAEALTYYVDESWAFLAVKAKPDKALAQSGALPPLSYTFASDRLVVPLKLEGQGTFPVRIYAVTKNAIKDAAFAGATARGFEVAATPEREHLTAAGAPMGRLSTPVGAFSLGDAPAELKAMLDKTALASAAELNLRLLFSSRFGAGAADPSSWDGELAIPPLGAAKPATVPPDAPAKPAAAEGPKAKEAPKAPAADSPTSKTSKGRKPVGKKAPAGDKSKKSEPKSGLCAVSRESGPAPATLVLFLLAVAAVRRRD